MSDVQQIHDAAGGINKWCVICDNDGGEAWIEIGAITFETGAPEMLGTTLDELIPFLTDCTRIYLHVTDGTMRDEIARRLGAERCLRCDGSPSVDALLASSLYPVSGVITVDHVRASVRDFVNKGMPRGNSTGLRSVDQHITIGEGRLTTVTGIPSHGKSEFIEFIAVNLAYAYDWRFAVFSPEHDIRQHVTRFCEKYTGQPGREGFNGFAQMCPQTLESAMDWVNDRFYWIGDGNAPMTMDAILAITEHLVVRQGIKALIIDPMTEVETRKPPGMSDSEYIGRMISDCKMFGRKHGLHIFLIAHPAKPQRDRNGQYPIPGPYDISGSAHYRNRSDNCLTVHREVAEQGQPAKPVLIRVSKVKYKSEGHIGDVYLEYVNANGRYKEIRPQGAADHVKF